jgi:hypothetical protein
MKRMTLLCSILALFILSFIVISGPGCANIIPPSGGPRDSLPPLLLKATPGDSTRNFKGNKITFTFDEFVEVQSPEENLLVSPSPATNPVIDYKLNTVTVKLKDTLDTNTTYTIHFGKAIKDFNEGNVMEGFTYTFSTGPYIDSLELRGKVILAETGKTDSTLFVMLHTSAGDSVVMKEKPRYIAKLNGNGEFIFTNLPPKTFYIYALKDEGGTKRYLSGKQLFAFADKPVVMQASVAPVILYAYAEEQAAAAQTVNTTSLNIGNRGKKLAGESIDKRLKFQTSLSGSQQDLLTPFSISFEQPLRLFDSSKIRLYSDSTFAAVSSYAFKKDSSYKKILLDISWKENTLYHIILDKEFAVDSSGRKLLKTDTLSFTTKKLSDYGSIKLTFRNLETEKNPVLQFVLNNVLYKSFPLAGNVFSATTFLPGEYELRILYDDNKNGKWDPGVFFGQHRQPEIVKAVSRRISIKPAWDNEVEINITQAETNKEEPKKANNNPGSIAN